MKTITYALALAGLLANASGAIAQDCLTGNYLVLLVDEHTLALRELRSGGDPKTDPTASKPLCYPAQAGEQPDPVLIRARQGSTIPVQDLEVVVRDGDPFDAYDILGHNRGNPRLLRVRIVPQPPAGLDLKYDILVKNVGSLDPVVRVRDISVINEVRKQLKQLLGPPLDPFAPAYGD